mmetsp:Transcript_42456/g.66474  ORF Transcript_42456/g.66474 Transcript_42456/m.66474 type:complete len:80 (-) Transcript_42456:530-769(-)
MFTSMTQLELCALISTEIWQVLCPVEVSVSKFLVEWEKQQFLDAVVMLTMGLMEHKESTQANRIAKEAWLLVRQVRAKR